jgi:hypothetical protein
VQAPPEMARTAANAGCSGHSPFNGFAAVS